MTIRLLIIVWLLLGQGLANAQDRPNILIFLVDDLGYHDLSCHGSAIYQTPNIDSLAEKSMRFEQAYSNYPRCVPSRYALLTGRYPIVDGDVPDDGFEMNAIPQDQNLIQQFKKSDYQTAFFGKWHLGDGRSSPTSLGFDLSVAAGKAGSPISYFYPFNEAKGNNKGVKKAPIIGLDEDRKEGDYLTDVLTDEVMAFIQSDHRNRPFLAMLSFYAVHQPLEAKEADIQRNEQEIKAHDFGQKPPYIAEGTGRTKMRQDNAHYAAMVENMDANVGRVMQLLKDSNLLNNTIIIFTSDHGGLSNDGYNQRHLATSNAPLRAGKGWLYEGGIRVPLFIYHPKTIKSETDQESVILLMDLFPTLLDWTGKEIANEAINGQSFLPVIKHGKSWKKRTAYWHESKARPKNTGESPASAIRHGAWKLIHFYEENRVELYRPLEDISEQHNLAKQYPGKCRRLLKKLNRWKAIF